MIPIKKGNKDKLDEALLYKRTGDYSKACNIYEEIYNDYKDDPIVNYDLAITKLRISKEKKRKGSHLHSSPYKWPLDTRKKLTKEAIELLRRAIQLFTDKSQIAWSWFEIANAMIFLKHPESQIEEAYKNAISYAPFENIFTEKYKKWKSKNQIN
jgi:tetratricopeptide (TPR) repeat protein